MSSANSEPLATILWREGGIEIIDQTRLPLVEEMVRCTTIDQVVDSIYRLVIRGAPALGVMGAYGVALAAALHDPVTEAAMFDTEVARIRSARPTAVNLATMVDRVRALAPDSAAILREAHTIRAEELAASIAMGRLGADLLLDLTGQDQLRVMTICNTGGLAAVERGTALAVIQELHERGKLAEALPLETRPLLQGGRLTTWELKRLGAPHRLIVDSAAATTLAAGMVDAIVVGADRIAANGDTANKIGTFALALAAQHANVPFVVVAPESTIDRATPTGAAIEIEERPNSEVTALGSTNISPPDTATFNPAFDVTPAELITAIVTDQRIVGLGQAGLRL